MLAPQRMTLPERMDASSHVEPNSGCLIWTAAMNKAVGYGQVSIKNKTFYAHRIAFALRHGPIPPGMEVCHKCDTRLCVNVDHLFLGTRQNNVDDAVAKGRVRSGERHYAYRLSESQRQDIANRRKSGESGRSLSKEYGVSQSLVCTIYKAAVAANGETSK